MQLRSGLPNAGTGLQFCAGHFIVLLNKNSGVADRVLQITDLSDRNFIRPVLAQRKDPSQSWGLFVKR